MFSVFQYQKSLIRKDSLRSLFFPLSCSNKYEIGLKGVVRCKRMQLYSQNLPVFSWRLQDGSKQYDEDLAYALFPQGDHLKSLAAHLGLPGHWPGLHLNKAGLLAKTNQALNIDDGAGEGHKADP